MAGVKLDTLEIFNQKRGTKGVQMMNTKQIAEKELEAQTLAWAARAAAENGDREKARELRAKMNALYDELEKAADER